MTVIELDRPVRTPYVGRAVLRPGDEQLLRGAASFVGDLRPGSMLHAAILRSPFAHARIGSIDVAGAASSPGVALVVTGREVHEHCPFLHTDIGAPDIFNPDRPLLAVDKATFAGEGVVAVVAASRYLAEDAVEHIEVDWDPLVPVLDAVSALADGAPQVHESVPGNCFSHRKVALGDVPGALGGAHLVIEREIRHPRVMGSPMECRGVVAVPDGERLSVWVSTQAPHAVHDAIVRVLGIPTEQLRVVCPEVGGGFGQKAHVYPEDILVPWLALRLGRPVQWLEDRLEHLACANHSRDQVVAVRAGFADDGRLLAIDAAVVGNVGAYGVHPMGPLLDMNTCCGLIPGPYDVRNYAFDSTAVVTNKAPGGAYRGVGMTTAVLVHERLMDIAARELGIDPGDMRRRNFVPAASMPYTSATGHPYESGDFTATLEAALSAFDYDVARLEQAAARAEGRHVGIGIASYVEVTAGGSRTFVSRGMVDVHAFDRARVWLDATGVVQVQSTCPDIGQGSHTTFAQVAADSIGVDVERVEVQHADTSRVPTGFGTGMSRSSAAGATAVERAAAQLRDRILEAAAQLLGVPTTGLTIDGPAVRGLSDPSIALGLGELVARAADGGRELDVEAIYDPVQASHPYATHVCMVEVDGSTGEVSVLRYVVAEDCGRVINPVIVDGQIQGGAAQGIGSALLEELVYAEDGQLLTGSFMDYLLPTALEVPEFEIRHLETPSTNHELGTKGVGEGGTIAAPAAIANAVSDALGAEVNSLPVSPERVVELLDHAKEGAPR